MVETFSGMVEDFQKKYESLQIPYPKDTLTGSIANQAVEQKAAYEKFVVESKTRWVPFLNTEQKSVLFMFISRGGVINGDS